MMQVKDRWTGLWLPLEGPIVEAAVGCWFGYLLVNRKEREPGLKEANPEIFTIMDLLRAGF